MVTLGLIVAAGSGERLRAGSGNTRSIAPKAYQALGGQPLLCHSLKTFLAQDALTAVRVVIGKDHRAFYDAAVHDLPSVLARKLLDPVTGGETRQESVLKGLRSFLSHTEVAQAIKGENPVHVLIHDAARPFVDSATIGRVCALLSSGTSLAACVATPEANTLKHGDTHQRIIATLPRDNVYEAQTPQGFDFNLILGLHEKYAETDVTDDAQLCERENIPVTLVDGRRRNFKITTADDLDMAEALLQAGQNHSIRTGSGIDVHAFTEGTHVTLGGIKIPHTRSLKGHSDADVVLHAVVDALLGAVGMGDIGEHFPDSEARYKNMDSAIFVRDAQQKLEARGARVLNVDITVLCEAPRLTPYRQAMRENIARLLDLPAQAVNVKATTTEGLGFLGRGEGIAAQAIATVSVPLFA